MDQTATQEIKLEIPTLSEVAKAKQARDRAAEEMTQIRSETEAFVHDLTLHLQEEILQIKEREEQKVAEQLATLAEERDIADERYQTLINRCVDAGVMQEGRYELVNKTRVEHPINIERFKKRFPKIFDKVVSIKKTDAETALKTHLGLKAAIAKARLNEVCDDIPSGPARWELEVRKIKGVL